MNLKIIVLPSTDRTEMILSQSLNLIAVTLLLIEKMLKVINKVVVTLIRQTLKIRLPQTNQMNHSIRN